MARRRDAYREVGEAMRVSIDAALAADLPQSDYQVLLAIHAEVASYSRLDDDVAQKRIATRARVSQRQARRSIERLTEAGAIDWTPGSSKRGEKRRLSHVSLPRLRTDSGPQSTPLTADKKKPDCGQPAVPSDCGQPSVPLPRRSTREDFASEGADGEASNEDDPLTKDMAAVCTARDRASVLTSSRRVFDHCTQHVDRRIIDEVIGEAAQWPSQPRWPSAILERIQQRAATYSIDVPDLELNPNGRRQR